MLDHQTKTTAPHEFSIIIELDPSVCSIEHATCKLSDALGWVEGVGKIKVEHRGKIKLNNG